MNKPISDKDILSDVLSSQKQATGSYNNYSYECAHTALKGDFMSILAEEQDLAYDVFCDMQSRGWYNPAAAQPSMIDQVRCKFESVSTEL